MGRLVVVSNRVPTPSSGPSAGGLAVALDGMMAQRGGMWFGWSGQVVQGEASDSPRREVSGNTEYATIDLSADEHARYYANFSNGVLWPLLHSMLDLVHYERKDFRVYRSVNQRLASVLEPMLARDDVIWIHDYHLIPLAACLRNRGVSNPIGFFLHIPFSSPEIIGQMPVMSALVRDLLEADVIGFQTQGDLDNFVACAQKYAEAGLCDRNTLYVSSLDGNGMRQVKLGVFPAEIDAQSFAETAMAMRDDEATLRIERSLAGQSLILGIDRLDPTKGLIERVGGFQRLLEAHPEWSRRATLLQVAPLSRQDVAAYRNLRESLEHKAGHVNAAFGEPDWQPVRLTFKGAERNTAAGYMRLARVGLVTPLRDGMNLVAKEYVAAQNPEDPGVLVLSQFAGAASQLDAALLVNPRDPDAMADALNLALNMPLAERRARWQDLWSAIEERSSAGWGRSFVATLIRHAVIAPVGGLSLASSHGDWQEKLAS